MKILPLMLLVSMAAAAQTKVVLTWKSGNVGAAKWSTCTYVLVDKCVYGFTIKMDGVKIAGPKILGVFASTYTQTPLPKSGKHYYSIVMNGYDNTGKAVVSKSDTTTVNVP